MSDAPDIIARVFKLKLDQLIDLIKNKNYFGRCIGSEFYNFFILFEKNSLQLISTSLFFLL